MTYTDKEYLGYCIQKGHIYSVLLYTTMRAIIAIKDNNESILITYNISHTNTHTGGTIK